MPTLRPFLLQLKSYPLPKLLNSMITIQVFTAPVFMSIYFGTLSSSCPASLSYGGGRWREISCPSGYLSSAIFGFAVYVLFLVHLGLADPFDGEKLNLRGLLWPVGL